MPDLAVIGLIAGASTWLLTYLLHGTVVVGLVWLLARAGLARRPTTLDLLWKVALVAPLLTASLDALRPAAAVSRQVSVEIRGVAPAGRTSWRSAHGGGQSVFRIHATAVDPSPACRAAMDRLEGDRGAGAAGLGEACGARGGFAWRGALLAIWLLGAAGLLVQGWVVRRRLRAHLGSVFPAPERIALDARRLLPASWRPLDVVVSPSMEAPCVAGGFIVLPLRCVRDLTPVQIHAVLAHEVAHLARRDPAWITFGDLVCRALWLQPLNRLALEGLRESAELVCDDWAVDRTRRPLALAHSIARVAEWLRPGDRASAPVLAHLAPLAHGEGRILSGRVRRILTPGAERRPTPWVLRLVLAALVVAPTAALPAVPRASEVYALFLRRDVRGEGPDRMPQVRFDDAVVMVRRVAPVER